ncbi:MAG: Maf family protein [Eubacteriales bacterium]|jgi:septum formation protein
MVLASKSPRRAELLAQMGYDFDTVDSHIDEDMITASSPCEFVRKAAEAKASGALALCGDGHIIIAADTVVELAGCVLGKPKDEQDARRMLSELSGSQHTVHTGLCVLSGNERVYSGTSSTRVTFRKIGNKELDLYIASGEPLDKAGAVGVQERGAIFVERVEGDFYAVVGLPVCTLSVVLTGLGKYPNYGSS